MKRKLSILALIVMLLTSMLCLPASAAVNKTGLPITDEVVTLTVLFPRKASHGDFDQMWYMDELEARTNIRLDFKLADASGFTEKKNLAFASDDYTDIMFNSLSTSDIAALGAQGILVDLKPYLEEYAPNIVHLLNTVSDTAWMTVTSPDGAIYALPTFNTVERDQIQDTRIFINKQWLDNLGLAVPTTLTELYDVLTAFRDQDANGNGDPTDEIPLVGRSAQAVNRLVLCALGYTRDREDFIDGEYIYVPTTDAYREYLTYMNKLYTEGLLDKDYFTQTTEQYNAKLVDMRAGICMNPQATMPSPEQYEQYIFIPALKNEKTGERIWPREASFGAGFGTLLAVTNKCQNVEVAVRLADYLTTVEGTILTRCGNEYGTLEHDGGYERYEEDGVVKYRLHNNGFSNYGAYRYSISPMDIIHTFSPEINAIIVANDPQNQFLTDQTYASGNLEVMREEIPNIILSAEDSDRLAFLVDLNSYVDQMDAKFITGMLEINDETWASFQQDLQALRVDELIRIKQAAYTNALRMMNKE